MDKRYQRELDKLVMANYCWTIKRDLNYIEHDRKQRKRTFYHISYVLEGFISTVSL